MPSIATTLRARRVPPLSISPRMPPRMTPGMTPFMDNGLPAPRRILLVDAEPELAAMVAEWLEPCGWTVTTEPGGAPAALLIVDVPFPRQAAGTLQRLAAAHAGTPILVLSPTFFASIDRSGAVARQLGVAGVLPKPLGREALQAAVQQLGGCATLSS